MKLTTKSEYTLLLLIGLARKEKSNAAATPVHLDILCRENNVPLKYAELLFGALKRNHIVKAKRGATGGYLLARPAGEISIAEVIRLMDGALAPTESVSQFFYSDTPLSKEAKLLSVFQDIRDYIANRLENLFLSDFM
jgi:Rrf2 family protein